jgi:uncharacterized membrane protein
MAEPAATSPFGVLHQALSVASAHGDWMAWNLLLAVMPVVLAAALFRSRARRTSLWWAGVVVFVAFLPNAPYVLTDVVHLLDDIRGTSSDLVLLGIHLPLYLTFFAIGFGSYVVALELARRFAHGELPGLRWPAVELTLHVLCAAGIYLGRVVRLNSWEILTRPRAVVAGVSWLAGIAPIALVACTAVVLIGLTMVVRVLAWSTIDAVARARLHFRPAS